MSSSLMRGTMLSGSEINYNGESIKVLWVSPSFNKSPFVILDKEINGRKRWRKDELVKLLEENVMTIELVLINDKTDEVLETLELEQKLYDDLIKISENNNKSIEEIIIEAIKEGINWEKDKIKKSI